jgi:hypothetical protein
MKSMSKSEGMLKMRYRRSYSNSFVLQVVTRNGCKEGGTVKEINK